jgi:hypothetical protein
MINFVGSVRTSRRLRISCCHIILYKMRIFCSCQFKETCGRLPQGLTSRGFIRNDRTKIVVDIIT